MKFLTVALMLILIFSDFIEITAERFKVVGPDAPLVVKVDEDVVLPCSLHPNISAVDMTVEWTRTDLYQTEKLVHLYEGHEATDDNQRQSYRGRTALFKEELHRGNTSLKLSAVQPSDEGAYKCFVRDRVTSWYDDIILYVEVKEEPFPGLKIAIICILVFVLILAAFSAWLLQDKFSKKKLTPAQCSSIAFLHLKSEKVREELNLKKYDTTEEGYVRLIPAITNSKKALFAGCNLSENSIIVLNEALQSDTSSLGELDLSMNDLEDSGLLKLCDGLKSTHCKLKILRLTFCNLYWGSCEILQSALKSEHSSLTELDLSKNDLQDLGLKKLSDGLKSSHCKLEILRLVSCNLTRASCEVLTPVLQSKKSLKELDLTHNELQDSGVKKLSDGLKSCDLEKLRLALCHFGSESCETLGMVLKQKNSLTELDLSINDLQDSGVKKLSNGLKDVHCKLKKLKLSGCLVTKEGCSYLASALQSNPSHLKELDLTCNDLGHSEKKLLSDTLESLHCIVSEEGAGKRWIKPNLRKYECDVTLDPNTANKYVVLSEKNKKVKRMQEDQHHLDHPDRFDSWQQVISVKSLPMRCYWEAEWSGRGAEIAVCYSSIQRKGYNQSSFGRNKQSWMLECSNDGYTVKHNNKRAQLYPEFPLTKRVGVYLDHQAGTVSFYSVSDTQTLRHLHTFHSTFTEPLYAGFWVNVNSSVSVLEQPK